MAWWLDPCFQVKWFRSVKKQKILVTLKPSMVLLAGKIMKGVVAKGVEAH